MSRTIPISVDQGLEGVQSPHASRPDVDDKELTERFPMDGSSFSGQDARDAQYTPSLRQLPAEIVTEHPQIPPKGLSTNLSPGTDVRYVLSGQRTGWSAMAEAVRAYDEDRVKGTKEDIDTLLVFAGLFSAVLTAFLIESYQRLSPQTDSQMLAVLRQIASQTASYNVVNGVIDPTSYPPMNITTDASEPFQPSDADIRINVLWFASLIFSLVTASFGMLVKQWLREYLAVENPSAQARLRIRHFRSPELLKWRVFEIAAVLPLLQQIALALFFLGLCYFTASVHESVGHTSLPLVAGWAFCFFTVTIMPIFFPRCPYKTTLLKRLLQSIHMQCVNATQLIGSGLSRMHTRADAYALRDYASHWTMRFLKFLEAHALKSDEQRAILTEDADLDILVEVDALQSNDELLGVTMIESLNQLQPFSFQAVHFVLRILEHRLQRFDLANGRPTPLDLHALSRQGRSAIVDIIGRFSSGVISHLLHLDNLMELSSAIASDTLSAFFILFSPTRARDPLPQAAARLLEDILRYKATEICYILAAYCPGPDQNQEDYWAADRFNLLIRGFSDTLEDLDADLTSSLECFESLINARRGNNETGHTSFVVYGGLDEWPWHDTLSPQSIMEAVLFLISTMRRALRHVRRVVVIDKPPADLDAGSDSARNFAQSPQLLVDGIAGMWSLAYMCGLTEELKNKFRSFMEECLVTKTGTVALLKAMVQLKADAAIGLIDTPDCSPCGHVILMEDGQQKLKVLLDAVLALSAEFEDVRALASPLTGSTGFPVTPISALSISFFALELAQNSLDTSYETIWRPLFKALTRLMHYTLEIPPSSAIVLHGGNSTDHISHASAVDSLNVALSDGAKLAQHCLGRIQRMDISHMCPKDSYGYFAVDSYGIPVRVEYEDWLVQFKTEDSVIDDSFVETIGRIYYRDLGQGEEAPKVECFRLKKLQGFDVDEQMNLDLDAANSEGTRGVTHPSSSHDGDGESDAEFHQTARER